MAAIGQMTSDHAATPYGDLAFEPSEEFMFGDGGDDEFPNLEHNMASLSAHNASYGEPQDFVMLTGDNDSSQLPNGGFDNSMFLDAMTGQPSASTAWLEEQSQRHVPLHTMQAEVLAGRDSSVLHQYGQITPPNDDSPMAFEGKFHQQTRPVSTEAVPLSATSERARNAANQRHAKAKKARKDSARSRKTDSSVDEDGDEVDGKREKYREKNRVAASKCRAKKKTHTEHLEESARQITATNKRLKAEERELRDIFSSLRHIALSHNSSQGCKCSAIHMYNNQRANEAARTAAMGLLGMGVSMLNVPSPSTGSDVSLLNSPQFGSQSKSRAQSLSTGGPAHANHYARSPSTVGQMGFFAPTTASELRRQSQLAPIIGIPKAIDERSVTSKAEGSELTMEVC